MALNKLVTKAIKDAEIKTDNIAGGAVTTGKIGPNAVESSEINDGTVAVADLSPSLDLSPKTVTLPSSAVNFDKEYFNISLLGFKMAVNESLTVFNLIDGVVDEFHDESGTDEAESTNDGGYCATSDFYQNNQAPAPISAGFSMTAVTEPDTSTAPSSPGTSASCGTFGTFTVPTGMTSVNFKVWGAAGGSGGNSCRGAGGGGGYTSGDLEVSASQVLHVVAGEGGTDYNCGPGGFFRGGQVGSNNYGGRGGGIAGLFAAAKPTYDPRSTGLAPQIYTIAGGGGGGSSYSGGGGGGLTANAGGHSSLEQTNRTNDGNPGLPGSYCGVNGGGGDQEQGGQSGSVTESNPVAFTDCGPGTGLFLEGSCRPSGNNRSGAGGAGYYGGGGGASGPQGYGAGGGGSSYYGHPQISSGSTEDGHNMSYPTPDGIAESGGAAIPGYIAGVGEGTIHNPGEDGYVLLTGTASIGGASSTTIISTPFSANSVPTTSRIVVFEEDVGSPTLNTDIIASISRDGGSNFTTATLTDSGYVTGASGQRILTGQATISGQPSGQSMRWKIALANNIVKIHGVSLSWA